MADLATTPKVLPSLQDLHHDSDLAFKNDKLNQLLNQEPPANWLKKHPTAKKKIIAENGQEISVPTDYMPIEKVEFLLHRIFQEWKLELLREGALFNSVYAAVRLHYRSPVTGQWEFHDGAGAVAVQTDAGKSAADLAAIKSNAVQIALPAAISYALKDAAEHLGKLFGRDINRKDTLPFSTVYDKEKKVVLDLPEELIFNITIAETAEFLTDMWNNNPEYQSNPEFMRKIASRKLELKKA